MASDPLTFENPPHQDRPALVSPRGDVVATWAEFFASADRWRGALAARGVRPGDRVVASLPRGPQEFMLAFAVLGLGAVWVSIPWRTPSGQARALISDAAPALFVCAAEVSGVERPGDRPGTVGIDELDAGLPRAAELVPSRSLAALVYTSGSTGSPKGVMISHGNLRDAIARVDGYLRHQADDRLLGLLPLSAPWGLVQTFAAARAGAAVVLPPAAAAIPAEVARAVQTARVTGLAALGTTWLSLVEWLRDRGETFPELRYVTSSGALIPRRIWEEFPRVFPRAEIFPTYGLSEAFRTTVTPPDWFPRKAGALGRACPGVEIVVVRENGTLAGTDEPGELVHRGECVTMGYWRRPAETAAAYEPRRIHESIFTPGERVHYSGDVVTRDADGFFWLVGREDSLLKVGGYRANADEIAAVLLETQAIRHALVFGMPHERRGHVIVAVFEPRGDADAARRAVHQHARDTLSSYQMPSHWHCWPGPMPLLPSGKLDRAAIVAGAQAALGLSSVRHATYSS